MDNQGPRITVTLRRVISLARYEPFTAEVSLSDDVKVGKETRDQAFTRIQAHVEGWLDRICDPIEEALEKKNR